MPLWKPPAPASRATALRWWPAKCAVSPSARRPAAKEIKGLIGASVERVASGSRMVHEAGRTMTDIVSSVRRVSDMIGEH